ncbi:MAG: hypothetical protein A3C11_03335 [Candidatus Sungbacteria bacterium RIFCSPHIGHO2_02_FULL_49_12]|uniref:Uncharacterized protein n=1 Tax=Candidatus Sungbacteria bacterium RIFCSPHIGHO2_02_FULL_49_12 TaxID=1802271 RepID=A0A1G2KP41_9BACT|nr:MAG: hypothetical protein A3C11_03335 [Candidatus Sungbacteria bacterium RIFCSPHIGHO2_02_FULL_49_12]
MQFFRYYFFLLFHVAILAAWYSSPFYLDWRIVIATVIVYYIQLYFWRGCLLTAGQFNNREEGFYEHYLRKLGFRPKRNVLNFILDFVVPAVIILIALARQLIIPIWFK